MGITEPTPIKSLSPQGENKTKPISRQQRRAIMAIEKEAAQVHSKLCDRFMNFILDSDDSDTHEVESKISQVSAQWKLYCRKRKLKPSVFDLVERECKAMLSEYKDNLK